MAASRLVCVVAAVAALGACTGQPAQRDPDVMTAPLDVRAVADEIAAAKVTTPMPPGATFAPIKLDPAGTYGRGSGRSMVEFQAACAWFDMAVHAQAPGDAETSGRAMTIVAAIPSWWTFSDSTAADHTLRALVGEVVASAQAGDTAPMARFVQLNCR